VLPGRGDGTFGDPFSFAAGTLPVGVTTADFNGDGRPDLAFTTHQFVPGPIPESLTRPEDQGDPTVTTGQGVSVSGRGDGTFADPLSFATGASPSDVVSADFDGDGRPDLAVATEPGVSVLLGRGGGMFAPALTYSAGQIPRVLVAGDFNGDGRPDLAVLNFLSHDVSVLINGGNGTFLKQVRYTVGLDPQSLVAGDFDGDGRVDLVVSNGQVLSVLLGGVNGIFTPKPAPFLAYPDVLVAGDFNGDGKLDLAGDGVLLSGRGDGTFAAPTAAATGVTTDPLVAADLNGDGRPDLAIADTTSDGIRVAMNLGGRFGDPGAVATALHATPLVADVDADGNGDVLVVDQAGRILWRRGRRQEPGTFDPPVTVNPGVPSRGIAVVPTTAGPLVASIDSQDNRVSFFAYRSGRFVPRGSLAAGTLPAQVVAGDVDGDGRTDLVVRNAGDGTASIFLGDGAGGFRKRPDLAIGPGASDLALAGLGGSGLPALVVTNQATGDVRVFPNRGGGAFDPPSRYRAGRGPYGVVRDGQGAPVLDALEETSGVAVGTFRRGGPPDLVAVNPGSDSFAVLAGLGGGTFADPEPFPTDARPQVARTADLNGDGVSDIVTLGDSTVEVALGDGRGGFSKPAVYPAGPEPSGLSVADVNGDGKPDLLIGNTFGDVLVLLGNGDGTLRPYQSTDRQVALAVADVNGPGGPEFVFANQALDRVVAVRGGAGATVVGDQGDGLLAPGAVRFADLNGDGIPDLVVANSGSNNVLVYPGLPSGRFGAAANGGNGFFAGTNPVGITVADVNGDGRPDLVIANKGSNDVSILLNQGQGGGFSFTPGPRLKTGAGPVATLVQDVNGDGKPDLLVSNSLANTVSLLPGVGGGFFNDQSPTTFPVGNDPGPLFVGNFDGRTDLVTVNAGSDDLTVISDFTGGSPEARSVPSGGADPVSAFAFRSASGFDDLVVANNGDGVLALLEGGADGLTLTSTLTAPGLPSPTALALSTFTGGEVNFYATNEGREAALLLTFTLSGGSSPPLLPGATAQLLPLSESALALVGTLLPLTLNTQTTEAVLVESEAGAGAAVPAGLTTTAASSSPGQSLPAQGAGDGDEVGDDDAESSEPDLDPAQPAPRAAAPWEHFVIGLKEAFDQLRGKSSGRSPSGVAPKAESPGTSPDQQSPTGMSPPLRPGLDTVGIIDEAIGSLYPGELLSTGLAWTSADRAGSARGGAEPARERPDLRGPRSPERPVEPEALSSPELMRASAADVSVCLMTAVLVSGRAYLSRRRRRDRPWI
jgi:hypothetical protein